MNLRASPPWRSLAGLSLRWRAALMLAGLCLVLTVALSGLNAARGREALSAHRLDETRAQAQEIVSLRAQRQRRALGERPAEDTLARISAALEQAGVPAERLRGLDPQADAPAGGGEQPGARVQSIRVTLEPMSPPELGAFLARWRQDQPLWTLARIELARMGGAGTPSADEQQYTVRLVMNAVYLAQNTAAAGPARGGQP